MPWPPVSGPSNIINFSHYLVVDLAHFEVTVVYNKNFRIRISVRSQSFSFSFFAFNIGMIT